jgi:hypothetical protein
MIIGLKTIIFAVVLTTRRFTGPCPSRAAESPSMPACGHTVVLNNQQLTQIRGGGPEKNLTIT